MTVLSILANLPVSDILDVSPDFDFSTECSCVSRDARTLPCGALFFCIKGTRFDGHTALTEAKTRGAALAVLSDKRYAAHCPLPWILIRDTNAAYLPALLSLHENPHIGMTFYAVTGTNGKTSVTYLLDSVFSAHLSSARVARIGTVENKIGNTLYPATHTTPTPEALCSLLCLARAAKTKVVILEASSHALSQGRLSGIRFACGIFTNLTEDHLDYHKSREAYYRAKRTLFFACDTILVNADDESGRRLLLENGIKAEKHAFSLLNEPPADFCGVAAPKKDGTALTLCHRDGTEALLSSPLCGSFAAYNITAAAVCALLAGIPQETVQKGLSALRRIPGRMEYIRHTPFSVCVDYAHTPDALSRAILSARETTDGRVLVLFGCGGDREREKRPQMGSIAATVADVCIITSDNSRTEHPDTIISEICAGIPAHPHATPHIIPDRKEAILHILSLARAGDTVLLCGKGHEGTQTDKDGVHPFSEKEIVMRYFADM